jgi:hypothetical protein
MEWLVGLHIGGRPSGVHGSILILILILMEELVERVGLVGQDKAGSIFMESQTPM